MKEKPTEHFVFLISTYNCIDRCISLIDQALDENHRISIFTFNDAIYSLLSPLAERGIYIVRFIPNIHFHLSKPKEWFQIKTLIQEWKYDYFNRITHATIYFFSKGYDLGFLATVQALCSSNKLLFENLDADDKTGVYDEICKGVPSQILGKIASWITGAPIHYCRPYSPIPVLKNEFFNKPSIKNFSKDQKPRISNNHNRCRFFLTRTCHAKVLWVYEDNLSPTSKWHVQTQQNAEAWQYLRHIVNQLIPNEEQFVKYHPSLELSHRPPFFSAIPNEHQNIPMELIEFPNLQLVIGISSYSLHHFLHKENITTVSILNLLAMDLPLKNYLHTLITKWINLPQKSLTMISDYDEFGNICLQSITTTS